MSVDILFPQIQAPATRLIIDATYKLNPSLNTSFVITAFYNLADTPVNEPALLIDTFILAGHTSLLVFSREDMKPLAGQDLLLLPQYNTLVHKFFVITNEATASENTTHDWGLYRIMQSANVLGLGGRHGVQFLEDALARYDFQADPRHGKLEM
ncbi:hypothetical protein C0991_009284 [Blastosporella zonata]|nr:hypothetical protein C0991_009284 [Blastosporella zonata]